MSNYNEELQSNNTDLQSILDTINALPDAGSSGGGASVETCTVTIEYDDSLSGNLHIAYSFFENGSISTNEITLNNSTMQYTIENLVCNSIIYAQSPIMYMLSVFMSDASKVMGIHSNGYDTYVLKITATTETPLTLRYFDEE